MLIASIVLIAASSVWLAIVRLRRRATDQVSRDAEGTAWAAASRPQAMSLQRSTAGFPHSPAVPNGYVLD